MINFRIKRTAAEMEVIADNQCDVFLCSDNSTVRAVVLCKKECHYDTENSHMILSSSNASTDVQTAVFNQWAVRRHRRPFPVLYEDSLGSRKSFGMCYISDDTAVEIDFSKKALMFSVRSALDAKLYGMPTLTLSKQATTCTEDECRPLMTTATSALSASMLYFQQTASSSSVDISSIRSAFSVLQSTNAACAPASTQSAQSVV